MFSNRSSNNIIISIFRVLITIVLTFFLITLLVSFNSIKFSPLTSAFKKLNYNNLFIQMIKSENHAFFYDKKVASSFSNVLFTFATNINPSKSVTLLGREIPGLAIYNTEIAVAGKGTRLSNIPIETPLPTKNQFKHEKNIEDPQKNGEKDKNLQAKQTTNKNKVVYIYQSHSWESYLPLINGAKFPDDASTNNSNINVIAIGRMLSEQLEKKGIGTVHDTTNMNVALKSKGWGYNESYEYTRDSIQEVMTHNKSLKFLFDIHRDSQRKDITTINIKGKPYARISFIIGKEHKNFEENLRFSKELNKKIEQSYPGLSRGVFIKRKSEGNGVYNQDLSNRSVLIEVGGVDNNMEELKTTVDAFAEIFSNYYWNATEVNG